MQGSLSGLQVAKLALPRLLWQDRLELAPFAAPRVYDKLVHALDKTEDGYLDSHETRYS